MVAARTISIIIPVKNGGPNLLNHLKLWQMQQLPFGWAANIIVVNDGSTDGFPERICTSNKVACDISIVVINNGNSLGRSRSINNGSLNATADYLYFVDADCKPANNLVLQNLIQVVETTCSTLLFGSLRSESKDFWGRYFEDVSRRRENNFLTGNKNALTTANCLVKRDLFLMVGGFDESYTKYGFEDRDLIIRANAAGGKPALVESALVYHNDDLNLRDISKKMLEAGQYSAGIFRARHPLEYIKMPFYKVDMSLKPAGVRLLLRCCRFVIPVFVLVCELLIKLPFPYMVKVSGVKAVTAISFLVGSAMRPMEASTPI